ncbi:MAG: serine hydrolase domain-containing protein, partial [Chthoniobacterales bacterium]
AQEDPELEAVDELVAPLIDKETPGLGVLVMKDGEVIHMKGYGVADVESGKEVDADSLFDLASLSKEMTALAAMLQIKDGLYEQDTPISKMLPVFAQTEFDGRPVNVGDLVHHLSGFTDYLSGDEDLDYGEKTTNAQVLEWLAKQEQDHPAGEKFDYSNSGYVTLGSLVAAADKADSLSDVLHARVWDKLDMDSTELITPVHPDRVVSGYKGEGGDFEPSDDTTNVEGDGNVFTSLRDLAHYERALSQHELLSEEATDELFENGSYDDGSPIKDEDGKGYAYGWTVEEADGEKYAVHTGSWKGTATYYQRNLTTGLTVIVLANNEDAGVVPLAEAIESALN